MKNAKDKLSDPDVRHAAAKSKQYKLADGAGLYCMVLTSGVKSWRFNYRFNEKHKTLTIGTYPEVGLSDARRTRDAARNDLRKGIDPAQAKQTKKYTGSNSSFRALAEEWVYYNVNKSNGWSDSHKKRVTDYLAKDIYPVIGGREIKEIQPPEMIQIIRNVVDRGSLDVAGRVKGYMQQVFDYAIVYGHIQRNAVRDINTSLIIPPRIKEKFSAITEPVAAGELLRCIEFYNGTIQVKTALRLAPFFWLRPSELSGAEWSEFNFETKQWILPATRRKLPMHIKKANRPEDALIIPLCSQAIELLENLYQYTGRDKYVFSSPRKANAPITPDSIRVAIRAIGFPKEEMTTHGFRSMARTMLEDMGFPEKMLELQLGHKWGTSVQQSYDRTEGIEQRTEIMRVWGNYLDSLRNGGDVIPIRRKA